MSALLKQTNNEFPFNWVNLNSYRESRANRKEIYLMDDKNVLEDLLNLFDLLFGEIKDKLIIYNKFWWDFCIDTWRINKNEHNYSIIGKSTDTKEYLDILISSNIDIDYNGCCACTNWNRFLIIILKCILNQLAPYSPLFCNVKNDFFFYFHHSGSIGIYYKKENDVINKILLKSLEKYIIKD